MNDRLLGKLAIEPDGIDQKMACRRRQLLHRMQHGEARSLVDIDLIDAGGIHGGDGPGDAMLANQEREFFAAFGGEQFRIAQAANAVRGVENDGGSHDGPNSDPRPTSSTPATCCARGPGPLFKIQSAAQFFQQAQLGGGGGNSLCFRVLRSGARLGHGSAQHLRRRRGAKQEQV
jgi:hypothetical protein